MKCRQVEKSASGEIKNAKHSCGIKCEALNAGILKIEQHNKKTLENYFEKNTRKVIKSSKDYNMQHVSDSGNRINELRF